MLKTENGQTKCNIICTDIEDRASGIRIHSHRQPKEKKEEIENGFFVISVCKCVRALASTFSTELFFVMITVRFGSTRIGAKTVLAFCRARSSLCLNSRRETILIECLWRAGGQYATSILFGQ